MERIPEKWKKYLILMQFGLSTEEDIQDQITRYSKSRVDDFYSDILSDMALSEHKVKYIIKLVPVELRPKLQNYIVENPSQLNDVRKRIELFHNYDELWWCKSNLTSDNTIFGRLHINSGETTNVSQYIEQVWADSARKIERIGYDVSFLSAARTWWGRRFQILDSSFFDICPELAKHQFSIVVRLLEKKRESIEKLTSAATEYDVFSICIEYKVINGNLYIVDWDSPNDERLIRGLI